MRTEYLLDTDTASQLVKRTPHPGLWERISRTSRDRLYLSAITTFELHFGCRKKGGEA